MRAKISVRVSKFWLTLLRNMRRRRKTRSIPSPIPVVLLFGLIVLLRYLNASSLSDTLLNGSQQATPASGTADEQSVRVSEENGEKVVSGEKRREFMERRHAERRAMHRRIEEQKHESHEGGHEVHESEQKDSQHIVMKENGTSDGSDRSSTTSDSTSHSEHGESQVGDDTTKNREQKQQQERHSGNSTETSQVRNETNSEHASKADVKKSEKGGMTQQVGINSSPKTTSKKSEEIPSGARVHGKQPEFGGSLGGMTDGMVRGQNVTRVSYTLFKIMRLFGFVSMIDSPAGAHMEWMPEVVERMSFDQPSFQYTAVDDEKGIEKVRNRMRDVVDGDYVICDIEERTGNGSDVVFHWTELDGGDWDARGKGYMEHIRKVMIAAKKGNNGYIVFGQFPRLDGPQPTYRKGKWVFVGEKEDPFLFNDHVRGVVPMGNSRQSYMLYMTFYSLRSIPMDELKA